MERAKEGERGKREREKDDSENVKNSKHGQSCHNPSFLKWGRKKNLDD